MKIEIEINRKPTEFGQAFEQFIGDSTAECACECSWLNPTDKRTDQYHQVIRLRTRGGYPHRFAHFIAQGTPTGALVEVTMLDEDKPILEPVWSDFHHVLMQMGFADDSLADTSKQIEIVSQSDDDLLLKQVTVGEVELEGERLKAGGEDETPLVRAYHRSWQEQSEKMRADMRRASDAHLAAIKNISDLTIKSTDLLASAIGQIKSDDLLASALGRIKQEDLQMAANAGLREAAETRRADLESVLRETSAVRQISIEFPELVRRSLDLSALQRPLLDLAAFNQQRFQMTEILQRESAKISLVSETAQITLSVLTGVRTDAIDAVTPAIRAVARVNDDLLRVQRSVVDALKPSINIGEMIERSLKLEFEPLTKFMAQEAQRTDTASNLIAQVFQSEAKQASLAQHWMAEQNKMYADMARRGDDTLTRLARQITDAMGPPVLVRDLQFPLTTRATAGYSYPATPTRRVQPRIPDLDAISEEFIDLLQSAPHTTKVLLLKIAQVLTDESGGQEQARQFLIEAKKESSSRVIRLQLNKAGRRRDAAYDEAADAIRHGSDWLDAFKAFCAECGISKPDRSARNSFKQAMKRRNVM